MEMALAVFMKLEFNVDEMRIKIKTFFLSNNNGRVLGGITTGQELITRFVVKTTSSILSTKKNN